MKQLARGELELDVVDRAHFMALYEAEVWSSDSQVEALYQQLDRTGVLGRTLIGLTSDHGESLGEAGRYGHGTTLHREVLHVPLVLRLPGRRHGGKRIAAVVGSIDLGPTLLELAGLSDPRETRARSLVPLLEEAELAPRPVLSELHADAAYADAWGPQRHRAAVSGERRTLLLGADDVPALYDVADQDQEKDLAAQEPEAVTRLRSALPD